MGKKFESILEEIDEFAIDHPTAYGVLVGIATLGISMPLCVVAAKYTGSAAGKSMAKELIDAGVRIGYTHS